MKVSVRFPTPQQLNAFLKKVTPLSFSYLEVGATQQAQFPEKYDHDRNAIYLGKGAAVWENAKTALLNWNQYPETWTKVYPPQRTFQKGENIAVLFQLFGVWWYNSCRIVYTIDEVDRFGFAYGTLTEHVEMGEEIFYIKKEIDGSVYYHVEAFSRPRFWLTKLAYPIARFYQKKFVRESKAAMVKFANKPRNEPVSV